MAEIRVPKLNSNDTEYVVVEWLVHDGEQVGAGEPLVVVETSKTAEELPSDSAGFVSHLVAKGDVVRPGQPIAIVAAHAVPAKPEERAVREAAPVITAPARALMEERGVSMERVLELGVPVIRRSDVEQLLDEPVTHALSRVQQAVGRAVAQSHATIPAAYTVVRMDVGPALSRAGELTRQVRRPVGLAELFVEAVASLHGRFPLFFAALDGTVARLSDAPHVGVTVDLGEGLYVPVIRDAAGKTMKDIASRLMEFRLAATEGAFRAGDLDGANIVLTLHTEGDVVLAIPFVFPGQVCALAVTAPQPELALGSDGGLTTRTVAHIGLAYDHRLINGRDAAHFLDALKEALS